MRIPILFYSAADRYNLGDVLYPIITQKALQKLDPNLTVKNYALTASHQRKIGALNTFNYRSLKRYLNKNDKKIIFVIGGDGINCSKEELYSHGSFWDNFFSKITASHPYILRVFQKIYWKYRDKVRKHVPAYPFHFKRNASTLVIYNSVGGSRHFTKAKAQEFEECIDFCNVRTHHDYDLFKSNPHFDYAPDIITLISELYPNPQSHRLNSIPNKFIFFQVSNKIFVEQKKEIISALEIIYKNEKIPFVLCPIGLAYKHDDLIALKEISKSISAEHILISKPHILDTITLLSKATLYIGTSLHGSIISMSYGKPYIGVRSIEKVTCYLDTWSIEELKGVNDYQNLPQYVHSILQDSNLPGKILVQKNNLMKLSYQNLKKILSIIKRFENA